MPVPDGYTSEAFSDLLLEKANVVTAPGIGFGKHGEGYVRVGLLTSEERLREAASRIAEPEYIQKDRPQSLTTGRNDGIIQNNL